MPRNVAIQAKNATNVAFAQNLANLMQVRGLNQLRLAKIISVTHGAIQNYLKGRLPRAAILQRLADYFKVSSAALLAPTDLQSPQALDLASSLPLAPDLDARDTKKLTTLARVFGFDQMPRENLETLLGHFYVAAAVATPNVKKFYQMIAFAIVNELKKQGVPSGAGNRSKNKV